MADADEPRQRRRGIDNKLLGLLVGATLLVAVVIIAVVSLSGGNSEYRVVVPRGTGERIAAGEDIQLIDAAIELSVGDSIVIVNDDDQLHQVGPFPVRAGETFDHQFQSPGVFEGECSLHPENAVTITVS